MSENTSSEPFGALAADPGDVGRRVALRRRHLGLTREETAARAGMAPNYLEYLETRPAEVDTGSLLRLAGALETSESQLLGGGVDLPPGQGEAAARPVLETLDPAECWARLSERGVGRVAFSTPPDPVVLPVNYQVLDGAIVYRTAAGSVPASAVGHRVAFEVDHLDEALSQGWSVLMTGPADLVTGPAGSGRPAHGTGPTPWAGGQRDVWVRIAPDTITGRVIRVQ